MKRFNVRYAETFLWDMIDITLYLLDKTESVAVSKTFYDKTLRFIEERSYTAAGPEDVPGIFFHMKVPQNTADCIMETIPSFTL